MDNIVKLLIIIAVVAVVLSLSGSFLYRVYKAIFLS